MAAAAAVIAATVVPALGGASSTEPSASLTVPAASPNPSPSSTLLFPPGGPGTVGSMEFMVGLPVGSRVHGVGFEEFTAGKNGPGYVMSGSGVAVVSDLENGNGRPCLVAVGLSEGRPRFCVHDEPTGNQVKWKRVLIPFDVGGDDLVLMFAHPQARDIDVVNDGLDLTGHAKSVQTKTSSNVRFAAYTLPIARRIESTLRRWV